MTTTDVLVACEFSGTVGAAFQSRGFSVLTCDVLGTERPDVPHFRGRVQDLLRERPPESFRLMIAHPPCTHLTVSGAWTFAEKARTAQLQDELPIPGVQPVGDPQEAALDFVRFLMDLPIPRIAIENPVSVIATRIRPSDQSIQPWQHGHGEMKTTCLWLKGLPKLTPSCVVEGRDGAVLAMSPGPNRWRERSRTYPGIAQAMADQWGDVLRDE